MEVHPNFSEAPHLRSSIPHPKTESSKNQIESRRIIPWPKYAKGIQKCHFSKQDRHSDDFGLRNAVIQKTFSRKCATSIVERVKLHIVCVDCILL